MNSPREFTRELQKSPPAGELKVVARETCINAMNLKHRLRDIDTDSRSRLHAVAPVLTAPTSMALSCRREAATNQYQTSAMLQDGDCDLAACS